MAGKKRNAGEWGVKDMNARQTKDGAVVPRVHEAREGVPYALTFDQFTWMPEADARVFLKDPAFKVINADDEEMAPLHKMALVRIAPTMLESDMVIANLAELSTDALVTRASQRPGGGKFSSQTRREVLIDFLAGEMQALADAAVGEPIDPEDMTDAEAAKLLGGV